MEPIVLSWSGGKDSALSLHTLRIQKEYDVRYLLTTVTRDYGRISMHGVREELLLEQARHAFVESDIAYISKGSTNEDYDRTMDSKVKRYQAGGIKAVAFGDIFLEDVRKYREERMSKTGMKCIFPIWGKETPRLARDFVSMGFRAIICTVDPRKLGEEYVGKEFDENFLSSLPQGVDPCGENGEFHSFVYDGPIFDAPIPIKRGETVLRDGFYFSDILLDG